MKLRLSDADRERLGAPELLDGSLTVFTLREAIALEEASGLTWTEAVALMQPRVTPAQGGRNIEFNPAGMVPLIWLGLHRAGVEVPYADVESVDGSPWFGRSFIPDEDASPGKDQDSADSEPSTKPTSRSSTRRTRSKTSPT